VALGRSVGLTDEEMAAMADPERCASFDARDKLVLRYSEVLTRENKVTEALYAELQQAFPREELVELAMTIGMSAMVNRVHATFNTSVDQETLDAVADGPVCPIGR
jgi:alkylhydroperoxidase family enzyme